MRIVFLDSTAVVTSGPGSPAYFSRYLIEHLKAAGHDVFITNGFYPELCREADAVVCEWANEEAFEAAASGLCKRLVVRLRGYDAFMPLAKMNWSAVDALVYESPFLKALVEEQLPGLQGFRSHVIPSGIDVASIPFKERGPGPVVALVARGIADKGYQLAWEWARTRPDIQLHAALALPEERLRRYLVHTKPPNVTIYPQVETVKWLDEINANFLLSASNWESLGYTIAEAMACGVRPLIHDTPGAAANWPILDRWPSLTYLNLMVHHDVGRDIWSSTDPYSSRAYRKFVEEHLDAAKLSQRFTDILLAISARTSPRTPSTDIFQLLAAAGQAINDGDLPRADQLVTMFRERAPASPHLVDHRVGLALMLAFRYYAADNLPHARTWALRSMADEARPDAMCLLGEIALGEDDLEGAKRWYEAASGVDAVPSNYGLPALVEGMDTRIRDITEQLYPLLDANLGRPDRYLIVVAVRNAEKYIGRCLASVKAQTHQLRHCVVVDDASADGTAAAISDAVAGQPTFTVETNQKRYWSLFNIVNAIKTHGRPNDVVVILDGDDELLPDALQHLDQAYREGAWLTYGNFVSKSGRPSWMPAYPQKALREGRVREFPWRVSHPKTFRFELFDHLTVDDFTHDGKWFQTAGDVALMLPLLELAGEHAFYISSVLYRYNDENDANDHKVDPEGQVRVRDLIYAKPKKTKLEKL